MTDNILRAIVLVMLVQVALQAMTLGRLSYLRKIEDNTFAVMRATPMALIYLKD